MNMKLWKVKVRRYRLGCNNKGRSNNSKHRKGTK